MGRGPAARNSGGMLTVQASWGRHCILDQALSKGETQVRFPHTRSPNPPVLAPKTGTGFRSCPRTASAVGPGPRCTWYTGAHEPAQQSSAPVWTFNSSPHSTSGFSLGTPPPADRHRSCTSVPSPANCTVLWPLPLGSQPGHSCPVSNSWPTLPKRPPPTPTQ